jgi:hypothetical protein
MPNLANVYSLAVYGSVISASGKPRKYVNVFSYRVLLGVPAVPRPSGLITAFLAGPWTQVRGVLHSDYRGDRVEAYSHPQLVSPPDLTVNYVGMGASIGDRLPTTCCVSVHFHSGLRGRAFRGTKRIGPVAERDTATDELDNLPQAQWVAALRTLGQELQEANGTVWRPVILSRDLSTVGPPVSYIGADVTSVDVIAAIGLSRHRKERTVLHEVIPQHGI